MQVSPQKVTVTLLVQKPPERKEEAKVNASERINLQHIMELREKFEAADTDGGDSLDMEEVTGKTPITFLCSF